MSEKQDDEGIRISQVLAGALAAVTAALLGSTMGVAGTVVGAGLASVVSTVGGAIYLRSIQRTRQSVQVVRAKVVGRSTVLVTEEKPEDTAEADDQPEPARRRPRWPALVAGSVLAFALGMLAVTGVEWVTGGPLSGGTGTTFGSIVEQHRAGGSNDDQVPVDEKSTPPSSTTTTTDQRESTTGTTSVPPTTPPTTTSTGSTAPTTTTTSPTPTTTTGQTPPGGTIPSN